MTRSRTQLSISRLESLEKRLREKLQKANDSIEKAEEKRSELEDDINGVVAGIAALREIAGEQATLDEALTLEHKAPLDRALSTNGHEQSVIQNDEEGARVVMQANGVPFEDFRVEEPQEERAG